MTHDVYQAVSASESPVEGGSTTEPDILAIKRHDTLQRARDGYAPQESGGLSLKFARPRILRDLTVISIDSLPIIL